jgi:hypothetical protein
MTSILDRKSKELGNGRQRQAHAQKKKKKKAYARFSQQKWPVLTGFDFGWMHNFFLSQIKPKGYLKQQ